VNSFYALPLLSSQATAVCKVLLYSPQSVLTGCNDKRDAFHPHPKLSRIIGRHWLPINRLLEAAATATSKERFDLGGEQPYRSSSEMQEPDNNDELGKLRADVSERCCRGFSTSR